MSLSNDCLTKTIGVSDAYDFLPVYPHNSAPGHNLHYNIMSEVNDGDAVYNTSALFKSLPFSVNYPVPMYAPANVTRSILNGADPCLSLVKQKKTWEQRKVRLLNSCNKSMVEDLNVNDEFIHTDKVRVHPNVALLSKHMTKDPDQHFNSSYNWYYSGSNIEIIDYGDMKYLIRPNGIKNELLFSPLHLSNNQWVHDGLEHEELKVPLNSSEFPCQIDTSANVALVREKSDCCYFVVRESNETAAVNQELSIRAAENNTFTSAMINKKNVEEFCTCSVNEELSVWNVNNHRISKFKLNEREANSDGWNWAHYVDQNVVLYANRKAVHLFDLRENNNGKSSKHWYINKLVDLCEEISCCNMGSQNIHYIGTNHHLLALDLRLGWTQRWTHGITMPPTIVKVLQRDFYDFILLGSQLGDNVVFIQNEFGNKNNGISRCHPYTVPSLRESLHAARFNGLCLDHLLTSRFNMSVTGLCCLEDKDFNIIRCTSVGDIFWQKILRKDNSNSNFSTHLSKEDVEKFKEFESKCVDEYNRNDANCRFTSVHRVDKLIGYLYTSSCPDQEQEDKSALLKRVLPRCKQLKTYRDYLAPVLLENWDVDNMKKSDDEGDDNDDDMDKSEFGSSGDKTSSEDDDFDIEDAVMNWINTYSKEMKTNVEYLDEEEDFNLESENLNTSNQLTVASQPLVEEEDAIKRVITLDDLPITPGSVQNSPIPPDRTLTMTAKARPVPKFRKKFTSGF